MVDTKKYSKLKNKTGKSKRVIVEGVKKVLYKKDGSRKMYVVLKGKMLQLTKYKEMKKKLKNVKKEKEKQKQNRKLNKKGGMLRATVGLSAHAERQRDHAKAVKKHRKDKAVEERKKLISDLQQQRTSAHHKVIIYSGFMAEEGKTEEEAKNKEKYRESKQKMEQAMTNWNEANDKLNYLQLYGHMTPYSV